MGGWHHLCFKCNFNDSPETRLLLIYLFIVKYNCDIIALCTPQVNLTVDNNSLLCLNVGRRHQSYSI